MSKEDLKAELEQLRKENAALRKEFASGIRLKVSKKEQSQFMVSGVLP